MFEITDLENITIKISSLDNNSILQLYKATVLKDKSGKRKKETLPVLYYLFEFLDAYNFTSEGKEEIEEEKKTLINASVLGLIFEKINGYKEGSYFTPGFITMYMCKETIRSAVVQKFNERYRWNCESFDDLKNNLVVKRNTKDILEANEVINSLKICDPAVGSGHFLVSALNEIIAIKSELGIFADEDGVILKGYDIKIENDELIVTSDDGEEIFEYKPLSVSISPANGNVKGHRKKTKGQVGNSQHVQEILFHEKQTIIENSLFGVDINPNSVKIAQLRLWIELLKNAYYTKDSGYTELETLPNIDINIKEGHSLISRFEVTQNLFSEGDRHTVDIYKMNVNLYKNEHDRDKRKQLKISIDKTKEKIKGFAVDPSKKENEQISKLAEKLHNLNIENLFDHERNDEEIKKVAKKRNDLNEQINILIQQSTKKAEEYKALYANAFEWRFEFPEVLDDKGDFVGFDVVIANPPYIPIEEMKEAEKSFYIEKFKYVKRKFDSSIIFLIHGFLISNVSAHQGYISPVTWQTGENYSDFRRFLFENKYLQRIINLPFDIFVDAYVDTSIYLYCKKPTNSYQIYSFSKKEKVKSLNGLNFVNIAIDNILPPKYKIIINETASKIIKRLGNEKFNQLGNLTISTQRLSSSLFKESKNKIGRGVYPFLDEGNVYNYNLKVIKIKYVLLNDKNALKKFYKAEPKVLIRRIISRKDRLSVGYTKENMVFKKDINPFIPINPSISAKYLLGILSSKLLSYFYFNTSLLASKDDFRQTTLAELRELPIPIFGKIENDSIVKYVNKILDIKKEDPHADTVKLESAIDEIVYKLYGLTEEEIKIIEKKNLD